jgi:hypothetical protein|tara:strand:- start:366 stop:578 length:213 start_codon:yes stop_codon:yes gene_type:complete
MMKRVEGSKHLFREDSGAIVNTDTNGYQDYVRLRNARRLEKQELSELKSELSEIKSLLMELTNGPQSNRT